ncbi:transposase [Amphibacillus sp. Q70]|uniref:transposase n=1 Tax=Amphibacillus sp. Q70 TaxID=3453416 RepID=UPI003F87AFC1
MTKKNKGGRKSKYHTHVEPRLIEVEGWARDGLIDEQIAKNLNVAVSTFHSYKNKFPELTESLKKNKDIADREVENALLKRALGYQFTETTFEGGVETKRVVKQVQPDTTAQIFWLKNRKPDKWRDKQDIEHSGHVDIASKAKAIDDYLNGDSS